MGHADAKTTEIYRHYAPDPSNGAAFVERALVKGEQRGFRDRPARTRRKVSHTV